VVSRTDDIQKLKDELAFIDASVSECRHKVRFANAEYFRAKKKREEGSVALRGKRVDETKQALEDSIEKRNKLTARLKKLQK